ncbi:MAG: AI-2E family transporter, partial [Lachnospiraceae bacterium]|nr:AI-2E family transporter [Lachnospiraceae bacterium]
MNLSKSNVKKIVGIIFAIILFYCALEHLSAVTTGFLYVVSLFSPFLLGSAIAFILNVPMKQIEEKLLGKMKNKKLIKFRRVLACAVTIILLVGIVVLAMFVIIPELAVTIKNIVKQVPTATRSMMTELKEMSASYPQVRAYLDTIEINWSSLSESVWNVVQNGGWRMIHSGIGVVSNAVSGVASFFIAIVFAVYILFRKERLAEQAKQVVYAILPVKTADKLVYVTKLSGTTFSNFLSGQCLEAIILGMMFFITMSIFRLPYAVLVGILIAFTALIPIVGAFLGCAIGALLIVMVSPMQALIFLIMFFVLQQIEGNLIYPHVVGSSVGLPSIWVLAAVTIGGKLLGVLGMLVFIPLCSVVYALFREFVKRRLKEKNIKRSKWENQKKKEVEKEGKDEEG